MAKLNVTLEAVFGDLRKLQHFYRYAKQQLCAENIEFLFACRQLNPSLGASTLKIIPPETVARGAAAMARYIYDRFIVATGSHPNRVQVNIDDGNRRALTQAANQGQLGLTSFDRSYSDVLMLVRNDTWKKFAAPLNDKIASVRPFWDNGELRGYIQ